MGISVVRKLATVRWRSFRVTILRRGIFPQRTALGTAIRDDWRAMIDVSIQTRINQTEKQPARLSFTLKPSSRQAVMLAEIRDKAALHGHVPFEHLKSVISRPVA
jgi:hypothetical protein